MDDDEINHVWHRPIEIKKNPYSRLWKEVFNTEILSEEHNNYMH